MANVNYTGKTNWVLNETVQPENMNKIEQGIVDLVTQGNAQETLIGGWRVYKQLSDVDISLTSASTLAQIIPLMVDKSKLILKNGQANYNGLGFSADVTYVEITKLGADRVMIKAYRNFSNVTNTTAAEYFAVWDNATTTVKGFFKLIDSNDISLQLTCDLSMVGQTVTLTKGSTVISGVIPAGGILTLQGMDLGTWVLHNPATGTDQNVALNYYGQYFENVRAYKTYTVVIDTTNPNPSSALTYADDALGMTPGSSIFDDFFGYKPCLFVNGAKVKYLNPDNFAQDEEGNPTDITTVGNDVMIEFPKRGYKIETVGGLITVSVTSEPSKAGYYYYPFSRSAEGDADYFYLGAYEGHVTGGKLYSSSGKALAGGTFANNLTWAKARGSNYNLMGWYQYLYIQCLFLLKYKNLNSQAALGNGLTETAAAAVTGTGNAVGMNFGNTGIFTSVVKLFGIENMWGNITKWVAGINTTAGMSLVTTWIPSYFSATDFGLYLNNGVIGTINQNYMSKPLGGLHTAFVALQVLGSSSTYFGDYAYVAASGFFYMGGGRAGRVNQGLFNQYTAGAANPDATGRLMYV